MSRAESEYEEIGPARDRIGGLLVVIFVIIVNVVIINTVIIIITRPKPASGRQGLVGSWGQDTDEVSTFLVFLTSHFAPAALSSEVGSDDFS